MNVRAVWYDCVARDNILINATLYDFSDRNLKHYIRLVLKNEM